MISRAYDLGAKSFVSLGEMNPVDFAGFPFRRGAKRNGREIDGGFRAHGGTPRDTGPGGQRGTTRKWRRKPLESLETDAEMAPPLRKSAEERAADAAIRGTP